nr:protein CLAVATA 3 [Ipomoea batatas]GMD73819.1 protein CLAVATA 3 [Ipomoea batatas]
MAYTMKLLSLTFMAAICFFLLAMESQPLDGKMVGGEIKSRKVQWGDDDKEKKEKMVEWELREAPMGPDPLHHHGGSPITRTRNQP